MTALRAFIVALVVLAAAPAPVLAGEDGRGAPGASACFGPDIGQVLERLQQARAFEGLEPSGYHLSRLDVEPDHLELGYDDDAGPAVTVILAMAGSMGAGAEGHGPHFDHRIVDGRGRVPDAARALMLRAASVVDDATPAAALERCFTRTGVRMRRAPAAFGVGMGALQVAIVILALALGVAGPRRGRRASS